MAGERFNRFLLPVRLSWIGWKGGSDQNTILVRSFVPHRQAWILTACILWQVGFCWREAFLSERSHYIAAYFAEVYSTDLGSGSDLELFYLGMATWSCSLCYVLGGHFEGRWTPPQHACRCWLHRRLCDKRPEDALSSGVSAVCQNYLNKQTLSMWFRLALVAFLDRRDSGAC